jgi:hypothetical protein
MQGAMRLRWPVLAALLVSVVAALAPLAYATPPDPTWLAGFWDDDDHDDVICLITSDIGAIEPHLAPDGSPGPVVVGSLSTADDRPAPFRAGSSPPTRAPPTS